MFGGQAYRYLRRSDAAEREAARWPLLALLVALTIVVPVDLAAVVLSGGSIQAPPPAVAAIGVLAMHLPAVGLLLGLLAPPNELVDRMLAGWLTVVASAAVLGVVFFGAFALARLPAIGLPEPWPSLVAAALSVAAGVGVVPLAGRVARRVVFGGRDEQRRAVERLGERVSRTIEAADLPAEFVSAVRESVGSTGVLLRRTGQQAAWAQAGTPGGLDDVGRYERPVTHLGQDVGVLTVWPRPAESALASEDRALIDALAVAGAPALHGARLASAFPELTERERQVLAGIVRGLPNAAIAARLGVSGKTVANYVSIVLTKLRVPDRERAAELARRRAAELG